MTHLLGSDYFTPEFPLYVAQTQHSAIAPHQHDFFELVYLMSGRGTHYIGATGYPLRAGDVYVITPNETHAYHPDADTTVRIVNVLFMPEALDESLLERADMSGLTQLLYVEPLFREEARFTPRLNLQGALAYRVEALLREMEAELRERAPGYVLVLKNMLSTLLVLLSRAYEQQHCSPVGPELRQRHAVVEAAVRYIEAHYTEPLSLGEVARHTAMSPSRLAHLFKQHTQRSLLAYLHEYRVGQICERLLASGAPVGAIAAEMGYGDLRFFQRVFGRVVGCTPTEYRRRYRRGVNAAAD